MPAAGGPSRSTVGGTTSQPSALGDQPGGVLAVGEGAVGEVPQRPLPRRPACRRPGCASSPSPSRGEEGVVGGGHDPAEHDERRPRAGRRRSARVTVTWRAPEAVGARAEVAVGVHRAAAERARRATGRDDGRGPGGERAGHRRPAAGPRTAPRARARSIGRSTSSSSSTSTGTSTSTTGKTSITTRSSSASQDSVIVPARNSSSIGCSSGSLSVSATGVDAGIVRRVSPVCDQLVEQLVDPLAEDLHLLLLQRDAGQPGAGAGLQEERALPGLADGARRRSARAGRSGARRGMASSLVVGARSRAATDDRVAEAVRRRVRRASSAGGCEVGQASPSEEFIVSTNGRCGGVADHRQAGRVDDDPLERVEVHAERVGQDRLDHVAVGDREPDRVVPCSAATGRPSSRTAATPRRTSRPSTRRSGNRAADGCACTVRHSGLLGERP